MPWKEPFKIGNLKLNLKETVCFYFNFPYLYACFLNYVVLFSLSIIQHRMILALNYYKQLHKIMIKLNSSLMIVRKISLSRKSDYSCSQWSPWCYLGHISTRNSNHSLKSSSWIPWIWVRANIRGLYWFQHCQT